MKVALPKLSQTTHQVGRGARTHNGHELGLRVSKLLTGAWRDCAQAFNPAPNLSEAELTDILPLLCESGAGGLAWWRVRNTPLRDTESGRQLHEVYRRFRLAALVHEREIGYVLSLLRAEGIEPVLVKGWAIARAYPDPGLRPYGDIDLCIRPDQFAKASAALKCLESINGHYVDLHCGFARIGQTKPQDGRWQGARGFRRFRINQDDTRVWDELFNRSKLVPLAPTSAPDVRILCDEDHLRLLSFHLLRSGARRPPWLCDVALLLESRAKGFDWDACLGRRLDRTANRDLNWVATTVGLAHQLLGADVDKIENTTFAKRTRTLPRWLVPALLRQWGRGRAQRRTSGEVQRATSNGHGHVCPVRSWTLDVGLGTSLVDLYTRWDNPVRATAAVRGQFNNWPRLPYRVGELLLRIPEVPQQLASLVEQFAVRPPPSGVRSELPAGPVRWNADFRLTEE